MSDPLLSVENLRAHVTTDEGVVRAVDGIDFVIDREETVCLVGESGSGKTLTCDSITGLAAASVEVSGEVRFDGRDLLSVDEDAFRSIRGDRIAYVFQHAQGALDPVYTVGDQIVEAISFHRDVPAADARERAVELLRTVGLSRPAERVDEYPHELSDGMRQRVAIAIALAAEPDLLIADEPTSALDVTIQARIVDLLRELQRDNGFALLLVTHDLRTVAALADRVVVLHAGTVAESGPVEHVYDRPAHPYTQSLFRTFTGSDDAGGQASSSSVDGAGQQHPSDGCRFRHECPHAIDACEGDRIALEPVGGSDVHRAACVYHRSGRSASTVLEDDHWAATDWRGRTTGTDSADGVDSDASQDDTGSRDRGRGDDA